MYTQEQHDRIAAEHQEDILLMFTPWIFCLISFMIIIVLYFYVNM